MAFKESRAGGGKVEFSRSMRWIEAVCGPSFRYLRGAGARGCGRGWSSILRTVFRWIPVSRATCLIEAPFCKSWFRMSDHCATSRYMVHHPFTRAREMRAGTREVLGCVRCAVDTRASDDGRYTRCSAERRDRRFPAPCLLDDAVGVCGPDEGPRAFVGL